jgi:hypothetical protein
MARDYIKVDTSITTATQAPALKAMVAALRVAIEHVDNAVGIMGHNNDGSNYSDVEALFGLPTGQGQLVTTTLTTVQTNLATARIVAQRLG